VTTKVTTRAGDPERGHLGWSERSFGPSTSGSPGTVSYYSASVPTKSRPSSAVGERLTGYLLRLLDATADRIADRVADRLATDYKAQLETLEVLKDDGAVEDLRRASQEPDEDAQPYEDVRRELGLA
jgi:hypothetical protein